MAAKKGDLSEFSNLENIYSKFLWLFFSLLTYEVSLIKVFVYINMVFATILRPHDQVECLKISMVVNIIQAVQSFE